jgi:hypothetical protein
LCPIRKLAGGDFGEVPKDSLSEGHHLLGFLCVDSWGRYIWSRRYDPEIGAAVADYLYVFMNTWFQENFDEEAVGRVEDEE